jgi:RHS repeat-associated protein
MTRQFNWHRDLTYGANGSVTFKEGATNRVAVYEPIHNERGALRSERLHVRASKATAANGTVSFTSDPTRRADAIQLITYNAKGQKLTLDLGNGTQTRYSYDNKTFRLTHLFTTRRPAADFSGDCDSNTANNVRPLRPCGVQNLHYTYDPVGNITHIQDDAQQTVFFRNSRVEPSSDYIYDALYRLVEANGREQALGNIPPTLPEENWPQVPIPTDRTLRQYKQRYEYDSAGNFVAMHHVAGNGSWHRYYRTATDSNRLLQTRMHDNDWASADSSKDTHYRYDSHGSMLNLGAQPIDFDVRWDHRDMIKHLWLGGGGDSYYQYDSNKQRSRKFIQRVTANGSAGIQEERIYFGGFERYRRSNANGVVEEIESHHLIEGDHRVLLVDDVLVASSQAGPNGIAIDQVTNWRYQYSNHLGSVGLELDRQMRVISHEVFHPYGTLAFRMLNEAIKAPAKRYRYTGMERDEESGLSYHAARYYLPRLGRWTSCDPLGIRSSLNGLAYGRCNPLDFIDPTGLADYDWPSGASFISPSNRADRGTLAHKEVLPVIEGRINADGWFTADTEVRTLPGGSKTEDSWSPGEIDLRIWGSTQGNKIADLKPLAGFESASEQTANYALYDDTEFSSKRNDRPLTDYASDALNPVEVDNRTYLLSQNPSTPERVDYYRYDKVTPNYPIVEYKPVLPSQDPGSAEPQATAESAPEPSSDSESGSADIETAILMGVGAAVGFLANKGIEKHVSTELRTGVKAVTGVVITAAIHTVRTLGVRGTAVAAEYVATQAAEALVAAAPPVAAVLTAGAVGYGIGTIINSQLSEETQMTIGGTINETLENGWTNVKEFYFGK